MTPALDLLYRPDLDLLMVRWLADVSFTELQAQYEAILIEGQSHHTLRWLLDVRRRAVPTQEAAQWVTHNWLPRAAAAISSGWLQLAYFISPTRDEVMHSDVLVQPIVQAALAPTQPYDLRMFKDEGDAVRWLTT
ncbi:hypothetical protein [Hymenobacter elongatus]|uniref:STAS/SEC14 domain-containing protein n=1 Tax=Hymenobacter elongatus TaxID=877208 RepID=A0A4Z0PMR3_9BACT|nr:hypothetical protein [Hymenobacter elongatus]TGE17773.1 hypothetical protein E5J99_06165 [Hymenobacter elongatus]